MEIIRIKFNGILNINSTERALIKEISANDVTLTLQSRTLISRHDIKKSLPEKSAIILISIIVDNDIGVEITLFPHHLGINTNIRLLKYEQSSYGFFLGYLNVA